MSHDELLFSRMLAQEKGLRERDPLLVIKTINEYSDLLLQSTSFPIAVSTGILRLSQTFRDCTDESIRFHVLCTLKKAKKCFTVFYGFDELCGRIFSVLSTTDPVARTLALRIYALFPEKLCYPHLFHRIFTQCIDSACKQEQEAAISLCIALARLHDSFCPFLFNYLKECTHFDLKHCRLLLEVKANGISMSVALGEICKRQMLVNEGNYAKRALLLRGLAKHSFTLSTLRKEFFEICIKELEGNHFVPKSFYQNDEAEEGECFEESADPHLIGFIQAILNCLSCAGKFFEEKRVKTHLRSFRDSPALFPYLVALSSKFNGFFHHKLEKNVLKEEFPLSFDTLISLLKSFHFLCQKESFKLKLLGFLQQHASKLTFQQCSQIASQVFLLQFEDSQLNASIFAACFSNWPLHRFPTALFRTLDTEQQFFVLHKLKPKTEKTDYFTLYSLVIWYLKVEKFDTALVMLNDQLIPTFSQCYLVHFFCFLREATIAMFNTDLNLLFNASVLLDKFSLGNQQKFHSECTKIKETLLKFGLDSSQDWKSMWNTLLSLF